MGTFPAVSRKIHKKIVVRRRRRISHKMTSDEDSDPGRGKHHKGPRSAYDIQRAKVEKLMKNPDKPVDIPDPRQEKDPNKAPESVYNVMGSSAGAGSGEFHVYRQIRHKEFARQKHIEELKSKDELNAAYHAKLEENKREADEKTAKKRAKRQKKKMNKNKNKNKKAKVVETKKEKSETEEESEEEAEEDQEEKKE